MRWVTMGCIGWLGQVELGDVGREVGSKITQQNQVSGEVENKVTLGQDRFCDVCCFDVDAI